MKTKGKAAKKAKGAISEHDGQPIASDAGQTIYATIELGRDLLVIRANEYKGKRSLDIRRFWNDGEGWKPSPKGVSIPANKVTELLEAFQQLDVAVLAGT